MRIAKNSLFAGVSLCVLGQCLQDAGFFHTTAPFELTPWTSSQSMSASGFVSATEPGDVVRIDMVSGNLVVAEAPGHLGMQYAGLFTTEFRNIHDLLL